MGAAQLPADQLFRCSLMVAAQLTCCYVHKLAVRVVDWRHQPAQTRPAWTGMGGRGEIGGGSAKQQPEQLLLCLPELEGH